MTRCHEGMCKACGCKDDSGRGSGTGLGVRPKGKEAYVTDTQEFGAERSTVHRVCEHRNGSLAKMESLTFLLLLFNCIVLL